MKSLSICLAFFAVVCAPVVEAANQQIKALFHPDPSQPNKNVFINKTPNSGYCATYPGQCAANNMFSIRIPVRFNATRPIVRGDEVGFKAPSAWRQLTVTNQLTQESEIVEVRISGIGSEYVLGLPASDLVGMPGQTLEGHRLLWTSNTWVYPGFPCSYSGVGAYSPTTYRFFWKTPEEAWCHKTANFQIPSMYFNTLDFAYELRTPNPLSMSSGLYTGSLTYVLGPGGDFEMKPAMVPDDGNLTLDFVLDVQHTLKVDLPPGGDKIALEPAGGWRSWIESGRKPTAIFRDQQFFISTSSRFKVMLQCFANAGSQCTLDNNQVGYSTYEVRLSMPGGIVGPGNADGWTGTLDHNRWIGPFEPSRYIDRKPGVLRFYMSDKAIDFLRPGMNGTLTGSATIIFDSEV